MTWRQYEQKLEGNLVDLHARVHRGAYRAQPSRRKFIPKADGRERPLGIAALEDKIVQRAVVEVCNAIYEEDFLGFSYGFRPRRSQHDALDALAVGITQTPVNWIVDVDVRAFFDTVSHEWLIRFVEYRIADPRMLRLIRKWLKAGVMDDGEWSSSEAGTPQGAVVGSGGAWLFPVPRGANQLPATGRVPLSRDGPLASHAAAAQPERLVPVGPHGTAGGSVPASSAHSSSVAQQALCRQTPQVEPGARIAPAGICAGGAQQ
jgi:hypothetical protein